MISHMEEASWATTNSQIRHGGLVISINNKIYGSHKASWKLKKNKRKMKKMKKAGREEQNLKPSEPELMFLETQYIS